MTVLAIAHAGAAAFQTGALVPRLLADAERAAAEGRREEAFALLRWASRVAPDYASAALVLAYHRVRGGAPAERVSVQSVRGKGVVATGCSEHPLAGIGGVESDAVGFPVLRFPSRAPDLDRGAFVAARPRTVIVRANVPHGGEVGERRARSVAESRGWKRLNAVIAVVITGTACWMAWRHATPGVSDVPGFVAARLAEAALAAGDPEAALRWSREVSSPDEGQLLLRARALMELGDTAAAAPVFVAAVADADASAVGLLEAARALEGMNGHAGDAADGYLRAFSAGIGREHWPRVAGALERAGRGAQAARVRALLGHPGSAYGSRFIQPLAKPNLEVPHRP